MSSRPRVAAADLKAAFALQPALFDAFWSLYGDVWTKGRVDHATKELVRIRNARVTDCGYCRQVRFSRDGHRVEEPTADLVVDGYEDAGLSARQVAALRLADRMLHDPSPLPREQRAELGAHFDEAEVAELAAALAMFVGFSKMLIALGLEPAPGTMPVTVLPAPGEAAQRRE